MERVWVSTLFIRPLHVMNPCMVWWVGRTYVHIKQRIQTWKDGSNANEIMHGISISLLREIGDMWVSCLALSRFLSDGLTSCGPPQTLINKSVPDYLLGIIWTSYVRPNPKQLTAWDRGHVSVVSLALGWAHLMWPSPNPNQPVSAQISSWDHMDELCPPKP